MANKDREHDDEADAERAFEALARSIRPAPLDAALRERMRARVLQAARASVVGVDPPRGTQTFDPGEDGWIATSEFARVKILRIDREAGMQEMLVRLLPGVMVAAHTHQRQETMVILDGDCHLGEHLLSAGDVHIAPGGSWHPPITTRGGALVYLRGEYPSAANVR